MQRNERVTKILFIDNDEMSFQIRKCIAKALVQLPPVELLHANDATEALAAVELMKPDVVVLDAEMDAQERDLFMDSLSGNHPPIMLQTNNDDHSLSNASSSQKTVTRIQKNETLEGIHQTLVTATSLAIKSLDSKPSGAVH